MGRTKPVATRAVARRAAALVLTMAIAIAAGCGDSGSGSSSQSEAATSTTLAPQPGGTLAMATFIEPAGLDPLVASGSGVVGGIEMSAIYDTLVRWDAQAKKYEMRTAESVTPNADASAWTLKLKPNIKFSDGTPYDADAVKFGLDRSRSGLPGAPACEEIRACPRNTSAGAGPMANVTAIDVVDPLTVKVTLNGPWPGFPAMLAAEPGMIPSPTAMKNTCPADKTKTPADCSFNLSPVGAGPFVMDQFKPKEAITMKKNPNYWGGAVLLDGLRFVNFGDAGGSKSLDALQSGTVQVAFLRDAEVVAKAKDANLPGASFVQNAGNIVLMNNGVSVKCAGGQPAPVCTNQPDGNYVPPVPTQQLKVRQAVAAAIDPKQIDTRAYGGKGMPGSELFQASFHNSPNVPGPKYDVEAAKKLVADAKAAGWDGKLQYETDKAPANGETALAIQAMLGAAGATVEIKQVDSGVLATDKRNGNYQLASHGFNITDDDMGTARNIISNLSSTSSTNRLGYKSAEMDAALAELKAARSDSEKQAAYKKIAEIYVKDAPFLVLSAVEERPTWNPSVQGIVPNLESIILFDKAWIKK